MEACDPCCPEEGSATVQMARCRLHQADCWQAEKQLTTIVTHSQQLVSSSTPFPPVILFCQHDEPAKRLGRDDSWKSSFPSEGTLESER